MLASWREAAQTKGINWKVVVPATLPVLTLDPDRLGQILGNLVSNAIKYTPAGGTVSISVGVENESVWIRDRDTTPGSGTRLSINLGKPQVGMMLQPEL